jgi:CheY-like chemotaxis protein
MAPQIALQVLVVDDDPGILSGLTRLLQRDGHMVQTAPDGQAALALLQEGGYDLILCDLLMPALDGQTLYGLLQWQLPTLCQRMIFLTGDTLSPDSMRFVEQCGQPWLPKPCGTDEIRTVMAQVLPAPVHEAPEEPGSRVPVEKLPLTGPLPEGVYPRSILQERLPPVVRTFSHLPFLYPPVTCLVRVHLQHQSLAWHSTCSKSVHCTYNAAPLAASGWGERRFP